MAEIGSVIDGKYEILRKIGQGGMSVVYLAMDTHLNKQWAVKEIRKKGNGKDDVVIVNSLLAEVNMMKKLDHPSLPRIVDIRPFLLSWIISRENHWIRFFWNTAHSRRNW